MNGLHLIQYLKEASYPVTGTPLVAFLGDSVYEVMVREYLLRAANQPAAKLHDQKVQLVCAGFQAAAAAPPWFRCKELSRIFRGATESLRNFV